MSETCKHTFHGFMPSSDVWKAGCVHGKDGDYALELPLPWQCGEATPAPWKFCPYCGKPVEFVKEEA